MLRNATLYPRATMGNVQWHPSGWVTASFLTPTANLEHVGAQRSLNWWHRYLNGYAILGNHFTHQSIKRQVPVSEVVRRMADSVPGGASELHHYPAWEARIEETIKWLGRLDRPPVEKWTLLTVRLPIDGPPPWQQTFDQVAAVIANRPRPEPSVSSQDEALDAADRLYDRLAVVLPGIMPAEEGELRWLTACAAAFGGVEPPYTHPHFASIESGPSVLRPLGRATITPRKAVLKAKNGTKKRQRRYFLQIEGPLLRDPLLGDFEAESQTVYQMMFVVDNHAPGWLYPSTALCKDLDALPFPTRVAVVGRTIDAAEQRRSLDPKFKHLRFLDDESEGDVTPNIDAQIAHESLNAQLEHLSTYGYPCTPAAIVIMLASDDPDQLLSMGQTLVDILDPTQTFLDNPKWQKALWGAFHPGSPTPAVLQSYERTLYPDALAGLAMFHSNALGINRGRVYGMTDTACPELVFRDAAHGTTDADGNKAATNLSVGDSGSGKTTQLKEDAYDIVARGGGAYIFCRHKNLEWKRAVGVFPSDVTLVGYGDPTIIDPLRVWAQNLPDHLESRTTALQLAERHCLGFLTARLALDQGSRMHDILASIISTLLGEDTPIQPSLPNALRTLQIQAGEAPADLQLTDEQKRHPLFKRAARDEIAAVRDVLRKIKNLKASRTEGPALFGEGDDKIVLNFKAGTVVYSAPGAELNSVEGRGLIYLATSFALAFLYAIPRRFNLIVLSELFKLVKTAEGLALTEDIKREGRHGHGGLDVDSQLARDVEEHALYRSRAIYGTEDADAAREAFALTGYIDPSDAELARLQKREKGLCFYLDPLGQRGWMRALLPCEPYRQVAFRTDEGRDDALADLIEAWEADFDEDEKTEWESIAEQMTGAHA